ncbi:Obg family GTPase CgtA [Spiroplasma tabanidicola]|uniref:GTPase Obg n=1 Tax=Spiroplasma tabanidicola TaxID=324079 RepID=A0A6I6CBQ8_9MOLU|nr:Obg family GTPase CgtA [Spiroplasma tabanidicola]QGS52405.1 GTPase ObgE [Spiroplasma tabanidicola]
MRFIDTAKFNIRSGNGGKGAIGFDIFYKGKPDGGNGGNGGNIVFISDKNVSNLMDLKSKKIYIAENGTDGKKQNKNGKNGKDTIIYVPVGTSVFNEKNELLARFDINNQKIVIAKGGQGGRGNRNLYDKNKVATMHEFEYGKPGANFNIRIEIDVLADVGFVGLPNAGKSTMLRVISNSKPEIANYPFTTLKPHLGICVDKKNRTFTVADLPGLIKGANQGKGLGVEFLTYIEKCKIVCHIIDMSGNYGTENVVKNYEIIRHELKSYNLDLDKKPEIVVANKIDLELAKNNLDLFKKTYKNITIIETSGLMKNNIDNLLLRIGDFIDQLDKNIE